MTSSIRISLSNPGAARYLVAQAVRNVAKEVEHHVCQHHHRQHAKSPYRVDPTRTYLLRLRYEAEIRRRFRELKRLIREAIVDNDVLGLTQAAPGALPSLPPVRSQPALQAPVPDTAPFANPLGPRGAPRANVLRLRPNAPFDFTRDTNKVGRFMDWLTAAESRGLLGVQLGTPVSRAAEQSWQNVYIQTAYRDAMRQAGDRIKGQGGEVSDRWMDAGFLDPVHADRAGIIYTRAYSGLSGITDAMDGQISRVLAEGIASGKGPRDIAREINKTVDNVGVARARTLARTEVINAHAEATLNSYAEAGVEGVLVEAEFTTSRDNAVCPRCEALEGRIFTTEEARGLIPVHPNCRCAWRPIVSLPDGTRLM